MMCASFLWCRAFCEQKVGGKVMSWWMRHAVLMLVVALLGACAAKRPAPVSDARPPSAGKPAPAATKPAIPPATPAPAAPAVDTSKLHTIQKGDTLISIALANGLDYRELAAWNNIENPNVIKLGEVLRLTAPGSGPG